MFLLFVFTDIDECTADNDNCDDTNGMCTNTMGSFTCACNPGFNGDGVTCSGNQVTNKLFHFSTTHSIGLLFIIIWLFLNITAPFIKWTDTEHNVFIKKFPSKKVNFYLTESE